MLKNVEHYVILAKLVITISTLRVRQGQATTRNAT